MKQFSLFLFALTWISACVGCGVQPAPEMPKRALAAQLSSETVALVDVDEQHNVHVFCTGVFVSPSLVLTAGHCVEHFAMSDEDRMMRALGAEVVVNPLGVPAFYEVEGVSGYYTGEVVGYNVEHDLGAIRLGKTRPWHLYAHLSEALIEAGDRVEFVGHPMGLSWSYAEGYVSAVRQMLNAREYSMLTLQIAAPVSPGNSGSGLFDANGRLIGIASWIREGANGLGFFVHRDEVVKFVSGLKS